MFAKDLTGCFSHCCVEGGDHWVCVCIFVARDDDRCKLPAYHSLEGFQHIGILQLFEVKLESCVFRLADLFQAKAEDHHQQVMITSNVCSWKRSVLALFTSDRMRFLARMQSIWLWCCPFWLCLVHLLDAL